MSITFQNSGPVIALPEFRAFEIACGWKLPDEYCDFLTRHNGGIPSRRKLDIPNHPDGTDLVDMFCGIGHSQPAFDSYSYLRDHPLYVKAGLIPIAVTACSSFLCLDMIPRGTRIVYIDIADEAPTAEGKTRFEVARDLADLFDKLH